MMYLGPQTSFWRSASLDKNLA